jgi:hypothetical protein
MNLSKVAIKKTKIDGARNSRGLGGVDRNSGDFGSSSKKVNEVGKNVGSLCQEYIYKQIRKNIKLLISMYLL